MNFKIDGDKPIFLQISEGIEDAIFTGAFPEETQIPSTTEISASLKINPATVLKGMNILVDEGIIYKKRGLGMFVAGGAAEKVRTKRQEAFYIKYIESLVEEAKKLNLSKDELFRLLERGYNND